VQIESIGKNLYPLAEECYETFKKINFLKDDDHDVGGALS
jgi:hypothetical protein